MGDCPYDYRTGCNGVPGGYTAVGYWGRDIHRRIIAEQTIAKELVLLREQIKAGGIRAYMWKGAQSGTECMCYKKTNQQADRKCSTCYGKRYVPGFLKFGFNTFWMSASDEGLTLSNTEKVSEFKSSKISLVTGALTGTVECGDMPFNRTAAKSYWEQQAIFYTRLPDDSGVSIEYSTNSGVTWKDINSLVVESPVSGNIRFKATLTRSSADILSPMFEIVRARYSTIDIDDENRFGPWVLLMKSIPVGRLTKSDRGDLLIQNNTKVWTSGMSMFDPTVVIGSKDELLEGHDIMFEIIDGARQGDKYVMGDWQGSDPFAQILVSQTFTVRYVDPVGWYKPIF